MRNLTVKQKKMLKASIVKYHKDNKEYPIEASDLPDYLEIEELNPCEIFWQNANCFVQDVINEAMFGRRS